MSKKTPDKPINIPAFPTTSDIQVDMGMTLLDYFAGQFIARGDTVEDAFRNAALAMKERQSYI
jgi:hypothetical protein